MAVGAERVAAAWAAAALFAALSAAQDPAPPAEAARAPAVRTVKLSVRAKAVPAPGAKRLEIWTPAPRIDDVQRITDVEVADVEGGVRERRVDPASGNALLHLAVVDPKGPVEFAATWTVERREAPPRVLRGPKPRGLTDEERAAFSDALSPNRLIPLDGRLKTRAAAATKGETTTVNAARALYDDVRRTVEYRESGDGVGRGDALFAADAGRGDSSDFAALFVGLCRARGIPARFVAGLALPDERAAAATPAVVRSWAEFHVPDVGWVPADVAEARRNPELAQYSFGGLTENRIALAVGREIRLTPPASAPVDLFVGPYAEVDGKPLAIETERAVRDV